MASPPRKKKKVLEDEEFEFPNDDVKNEVLTRLSPKSLLRLMCVSKRWQCMISDASFRQIHCQKTKPILNGFYFQERFYWCEEDLETVTYISVDSHDTSLYKTTLDFLPEKVVLLASSNGLLCCRRLINAKDTRRPIIYVCNPCTKEYVSLKWAEPDKNSSVALLLDQFSHNSGGASTSSRSVSYGFKLLNIYKIESAAIPCFRFKLYSSRIGKWRLMKDVCFIDSDLLKNGGVFANGLFNWLTTSSKIITFDVETEKAQLINTPPTTQPSCIPEMCIGESDGLLHYIYISEIGFQDWILTDAYNSEWMLNHSISLAFMEDWYPEFLYNMSTRVSSRLSDNVKPWVDPLAFKDDFLFLIVCSTVYLFNFETLEMKRLCSVVSLGSNALGGAPIVLPYSMSMSLVPLDNAAILPEQL